MGDEYSGWKWLVSAFQGNAIAVKADLPEGFDYTMDKLPEKFQYVRFTNIIFRPPHSFAFLPWPVEVFGLVEGAGWMYGKELPFLRKPSDEMVVELDKQWMPVESETGVKAATEADANRAVAESKAKLAVAEALKRGKAGGPVGLVK